jgi:hypothetical protein
MKERAFLGVVPEGGVTCQPPSPFGEMRPPPPSSPSTRPIHPSRFAHFTSVAPAGVWCLTGVSPETSPHPHDTPLPPEFF